MQGYKNIIPRLTLCVIPLDFNKLDSVSPKSFIHLLRLFKTNTYNENKQRFSVLITQLVAPPVDAETAKDAQRVLFNYGPQSLAASEEKERLSDESASTCGILRLIIRRFILRSGHGR